MKPLHQARRLWLEELEPRFLLSADIAPFVAESAPFPETVVHQAVVDVLHQTTPAATAPVVPGRFELVFIDASVPGYAQLAADVEAQNDGWRHIDVVVLDPSRDGIAQVSETLASRVQLDAVHFITHGADGAVQLGGSRFDSNTLAANERAVANWGQALKADADLLFYGCDVAANERGQAFLDRLSAVTRADVAASENLTGAQSLGGDWKLEFSTGVIESALAVSPREQQLWAGVLGSQTLDFDTNPTSATWTANTFGPYSFPVGTGSVGISVTGDTGVFSSPTPDVESTFNGGTGERALRLQTAGFGPGQSTTITLDFTAFGGGVSNVSFMVFDIDTSADGAGFVDSVKVTANNGAAINPTSVVLGDQTLGGPGPYTAYDVFDGVNTVTGDPAQDRNSGNSESYGNARFTFNASGISSVTIVYSNLRGLSPQGIALHDVSFDPTPTAADRTVATSEDTAYVFTTAGFGYLDPDADPMQSVRITQLPTAGTLTLAGFGTVTLGQTIAAADIAAGKLAFAAAADANGTPYGSFRFRVSDGAGFSRADYAMTVDVTAVNDAPSFGPLLDQSASEDSGAHTVIGFAVASPGGGSDESGQTFTYAVSNDNAALFAGAPSITPDGTLGYTLAPNAFGNATVTVSVQDSGGTANGGQDAAGPLAFTLTVTPLNDAPIASGAASLAAILEDSPNPPGATASALFAANYSDATDASLASPLSGVAIVANSAAAAEGTWQYSAGGSTAWTNIPTGGLGDASALVLPAGYFLRFLPAIDYNGAPGTLSVRLSDGSAGAIALGSGVDISAGIGGTGNWSSASVALSTSITQVNDAPVLANPSVLAYTENGPASPVNTLIGVGDVDNATLASATVAITGNFAAGEDLLGFVNDGATMGNISGSYAAGVLSLSSAGASATLAEWHAALRAVTYANTSDNPSTLARTLTYTVSDAAANSNSLDSTVTIAAVNDAPTTAASGGVLSYTENDPATRIDGTLTVFDVDNADLAGATVQLAGGTYQPGEDILAFDRALLPGGVTASWNAGAGTLSFTGTAPVLQYQALLRSVSYQNTSDDPSAAPRTVSFVVDDGTAPSAPATRDIAVTPVNDAPTIVANQLTIGDGQTVVLTPANLVTIDPDNPPTDLSFTVSAVQNGRFELIGAPGVPITTFTYVQLAAGQVQFVHAGGNQVPSYVVTPSDGALAGTATMAAIAFMPSLGTAGDFGTLSPQAGGGDIALAVLAPPTPSASSGTSLASPSMRDTAPIPRGLAEFEPIVLPEQPILAAPSRVAVVAGDPGIAKIDPKADYEPLRVLQMPGPHVGFDLGRLAFDDAQGRGDVEVLMGSVKMTGLVLSVGVIWWASRAAGLIASALSALPAWRNFDPIFVVGRDEDDDFKWETPQDEEAQREEEAVAEALDSVRRPDPADRSGSSKAQREGTSDQVIPAKPMIARRP